MTDEEVMDWTFRLAKTCQPLHSFLSKLIDNNIGLVEDDSFSIVVLSSSIRTDNALVSTKG